VFLLSRQRATQQRALQRAVQRNKATQRNAVVEMLFNTRINIMHNDIMQLALTWSNTSVSAKLHLIESTGFKRARVTGRLKRTDRAIYTVTSVAIIGNHFAIVPLQKT